MGCAFSRNKVRVPRIFRRKKGSRTKNFTISTPPKVIYSSTRDVNYPTPSERPATPNNNYTADWNKYTPDVAPSILAWLIGAKDCHEDSIPELAYTNKFRETSCNQESKERHVVLPACLDYQGYHEYGFHLFTLNSSLFNSTVQDMSLNCIPEAIASVLSDCDEPFIMVYKNKENKTTYLPDPPAWGIDVLGKICSRFGEQLLRVVLYQPSWYIQVILDEQPINSRFSFSTEVRTKLRVTSDFKELAKLTGFPGEIKRTRTL
ncbi:uncharacterized protein LOC144657176 [Oculina patagonica]